MARGSLEADGALVEVAIDTDVAKFPALKTGLMIVGVVMGEGSVMVTASPPDFCASNGGFFFSGQRGQQGRRGRVLGSGSFLNKVLSGGQLLEIPI